MNILEFIKSRNVDFSRPFLVNKEFSLSLADVANKSFDHLNMIKQGDVVALIGDFNEQTIADLLHLINMKTILVPLTNETYAEHPYFFETARVKWVVQNGKTLKIDCESSHPLIDSLRLRNSPGLVLFSTGTTGRPKAVLHDFSRFLQRYSTPRPAATTLNFLLFDHIGGINTLLHSLFNSGLVVSIQNRSIEDVLETCEKFQVEVLPTTPTFLRMLLMSGLVPETIPSSIKVITYGTEKMDEHTLVMLANHLPNVDFRQTYGMSELGILRVKSESRTSLFMRVGGEGVVWKIEEGVLKIKSETRMAGYLNAENPFDENGWYNTNDLVEAKGDFLKIVGRTTNVVNVGGLKFLTGEVESAGMSFPGILNVNVIAKTNPITGQHVEMTIQVQREETFNLSEFKSHLASRLPKHMLPRRITTGSVLFNHRYKKS
jgi:long-chain acyl-CoA synthetase